MDEPFPPPGFKSTITTMEVFNIAYFVWFALINLSICILTWAVNLETIGHVKSYSYYNSSDDSSKVYTFNYEFQSYHNYTYLGEDHLTFENMTLLEQIISSQEINVYYAKFSPHINGLSSGFARAYMSVNIVLALGMLMIWIGINMRHYRRRRYNSV